MELMSYSDPDIQSLRREIENLRKQNKKLIKANGIMEKALEFYSNAYIDGGITADSALKANRKLKGTL